MNPDETAFVDKYGGVYEHSPWIAQASYERCQDLSNVDDIAKIMADVVDAAGTDAQLALIRAHPDLAGRLAVAGELTAESNSEQSAAGLDQCSPSEFEAFQSLNAAYVDKFGFPFIMAVRNSHRTEILDSFRTRLDNDYDTEYATALEQIHQIARLRLEALKP